MQKQIKAFFIAAALLIPATLPTFAQDPMKDKMEEKMKGKKMTSHKMKGKKHKMSKMHKRGKKMDGPMEEKKP